MQERMFKSILESVLSSVNMRIDKVVKSVAELKASLEYSQDMDDLIGTLRSETRRLLERDG